MPRPPSHGIVTSPWGMRFNPNDGIWRMHYGEDTAGEGNYAPVTGEVVFAGWDKTGTGLGWAVGIRETRNPSVIWWTGHFGTTSLWNPLKVKVGSKVSEGYTYLGPKGSTGAAKGAHAHQERRVAGVARPGSGTPTNPRSYYTTPAGGGGVTPIPDPPKELVMRETQWYQMVDSNGADVADWSRVGADVLPTGNFLGGYEATADVNVARLWGRQIQGPHYSPVKLPRADYIAVQQWGHREYLAHRADDIARVSEGSGDPSAAAETAALVVAGLTSSTSPLLTAIDALDDDDRAADRAAISAALAQIKPGATADEFVAALKAAL